MPWNDMYLPLYETGYLTQVTAYAVVTLGTEFDKDQDKITSGWN